MFANAPQAANARRACDSYRQLERRCGCTGTENYFANYGRKYCERFVQSSGWSPAGLRWRERTRTCLNNELDRFVAHAGVRRDCAAVKAFAFESHARCYTAPPASVCRLPLADIRRIFALVDATDLFAPSGAGQTLAIALSCVWQNGNAEARPDGLR